MEHKRELSIPVAYPERQSTSPTLTGRAGNFILRSLGFFVVNISKLCLGWLDRPLAKRNERRLASDIQKHLAFLFTDFPGKIIPNSDTSFVPSFDYAFVRVAVNPLLLKFCRGRGEFSVQVGSEFLPDQWEDYQLVAQEIGKWTSGRTCYKLESFAPILRRNLEHLTQAMSAYNFEATFNLAVHTHNNGVDECVSKLRDSGVEPKIYEQE